MGSSGQFVGVIRDETEWWCDWSLVYPMVRLFESTALNIHRSNSRILPTRYCGSNNMTWLRYTIHPWTVIKTKQIFASVLFQLCVPRVAKKLFSAGRLKLHDWTTIVLKSPHRRVFEISHCAVRCKLWSKLLNFLRLSRTAAEFCATWRRVQHWKSRVRKRRDKGEKLVGLISTCKHNFKSCIEVDLSMSVG